jgi:hypothetical protein
MVTHDAPLPQAETTRPLTPGPCPSNLGSCEAAPPGDGPALARGPGPAAFRIPCPTRGTVAEFPFDLALSAKLDQLLWVEELPQDLLRAHEAVGR